MAKYKKIRRIVRALSIELAIYFIVVVAYFFFVLRYLREWLSSLYHTELVLYAFISIGLIVLQAIFLEIVTSFLLRHTPYDIAEE